MNGRTQAPADRRVAVCVIGAGAAGLWAARAAAARGQDVLLLEKTPRTGTKVLVSGGTKCNLTTTLGPDDAAALFGLRGERFLRSAFRNLPPARVREQFERWGVRTVDAPLEKVFPASGKAVHVRDALENAAREVGVRIDVGARVVGLEPRGGAWCVALHGGGAVMAHRVVVCAGGKSYPTTGTVGEAYEWFEQLGCEIVEPVPALVPLTSDDARITDLTGIAVQDVVVRLVSDDGRVLGERARPVLFTHTGVSGPGAMDHSVHVARAVAGARAAGRPRPRFELALDLLPGHERQTLRELLIDAAGRPGLPRVGRTLPVELPRRLVEVVAEQAGLGREDPPVQRLGKSTRHSLVEALKRFRVPIDGTLGFDKAEATAGGLALPEVDPRSMAVRGRPGLFACGEVLDVAGPIGGLNFQAAFATAELAGYATTLP